MLRRRVSREAVVGVDYLVGLGKAGRLSAPLKLSPGRVHLQLQAAHYLLTLLPHQNSYNIRTGTWSAYLLLIYLTDTDTAPASCSLPLKSTSAATPQSH